KLIMTRNLEQLKSTKEKKKLNFSVGAQFASSASFNNPQSSNYAGNSFMATDAVPQPSKVENLKAGMGAGLTFEVKTSKRISIQSGVFYSRLQQGNRGLSVSNDSWPATFTSLMASQPMLVKNNTTWVANSAWGIARIRQYPLDDFKANAVRGDLTTYATTSEGVDFNQQAEYIEVPLLLRYKLFEHRFRFDLLGGLGANFLVGNDFYQISKGERVSIGKTDDMNNFSYSSIMGMGMSYGLTPTIRISLEPKLKYFLNSLSNSATVDMKPWIFGVYAGLNFNF
ncbi:MAG: hypothetical protein Q8862_10020, partial [Bacteroidota bacterium]|nr:hypothetical protein [Bacteroidota bacterium]